MSVRSIVAWAVCAAVGCGGAFAAPPRVAVMTPDHGDIGVDPDLANLRIEFDQDMSPGGRSICGGGESFPTISGPPVWESPRVLLVPVKLEAGRHYRLSINCPAAQNFRGANGEPAESTPLAFHTASAGGRGASAPPPTPEENDAAIEELRRLIAESYSYRDRVVRDWREVISREAPAMRGATTRAAFARSAARALAMAKDVHITLGVNDATFPTYRVSPDRNFDLRSVREQVKGLTEHNSVVSSGELEGGVGYLLITGWSSDAAVYEPAFAVIERFKDAPALVIDVRPNGGGNELQAKRIAARFTRERSVYSRNAYRDATSPTGFSRIFEREIEPDPEHPRFDKPVAVLIGNGCMSSNESFVLMMRHGVGAVLVGDRTFGASGKPEGHNLGNGVQVRLPSWKDLLPDGTELEGRGVSPDVSVPERVSATDDPVIRAALRKLAEPR